MPIEFACTECKSVLRTADDTAGMEAKCPNCGAVTVVPSADIGSADESSGPAEAVPEANPYAAPSADTSESWGDTEPPPTTRRIIPTPVGVGPVLRIAWQTWQAHLGLLVGITLVVVIVEGIFQVAVSITEGDFPGGPQQPLLMASLVVNVLSWVVSTYLGIGYTQIALGLLRGERVEFGRLFAGGPLLGRTLGASVIAGIAMTIGLLLCVVPGLVLACIYWPFYYLIVDRHAGALESFSMAAPIGKLNATTTIALWFISLATILVGLLACGIGVLLAMPLVSLFWAAAYLAMSGQLRVE